MSSQLSELLRLIAHERRCERAHMERGNIEGAAYAARCAARYEALAVREGWCAEPERIAA